MLNTLQPWSKRRARVVLLAAAALPALLAACATAPAARPPGPAFIADPEVVEERALLLLLADRRLYEPIAINRALAGDPAVRRLAALTLGRIGDPRGLAPLERLLGDAVPEVRRAAAFALGELGEQGLEEAQPALLGALADPDRAVGRLAVEGLAKSGAALTAVIERLIAGPPPELLPRLVPSLWRFQRPGSPEPAVLSWAEQGLEADDPEVRALAAYALARQPLPEAAPKLRALLADPDPWVRGQAARALGIVGERGDVELLRPLLDDPAPGPILQALRAARRLFADGKAAPPPAWRPRLLELLADPRPGVRLTAIEVAAIWLLDDDLGAALAALAQDGVRRERELALLALAEGEDPRAAVLLVRAAADPDPVLRARAAEAAGLYRSLELLRQLLTDPEPRVRRAALETLLASEPEDAAALLRQALADRDPTVRAAALAWAEEHPLLEMEEITAAIAAARGDRILDVRIAGVQALRARAEAEPLDRGAIVAELEGLATAREYLVRRAAARALVALGREAPAPGEAAARRPIQVYREIAQRTAVPRRLDVVTARGTIGVELACGEAPLTCLNFLQLAGQGFYDGLTFHRVVPDFVVQSGDPRGDGWGGPGYSLRDEVSPLSFDRGVLGMAHSGPDTAGSQFFVTLSPQPHLDGAYTAFGRVVAGEAVLDQLVEGDALLRIVEAGGV